MGGNGGPAGPLRSRDETVKPKETTVKRATATQAQSLQEVRAWIAAETRARQLEEHDNPNVTLAPTGRFPSTPHFRHENDAQNAATGEEARMLRGLIAGKCCGWPQPPSVDKAVRAMQTRPPRSARSTSPRQSSRRRGDAPGSSSILA